MSEVYVWGCTDSNREPSDYEPPALTVELHPRSISKDAGKNEKIEVKYNASCHTLRCLHYFFETRRTTPASPNLSPSLD